MRVGTTWARTGGVGTWLVALRVAVAWFAAACLAPGCGGVAESPQLSVRWGDRVLSPADTVEVPVEADVGVESLVGELILANTGAPDSTLEVSDVHIESSPAGAFRVAGRDGAELPTVASPWEIASAGASGPAAPAERAVQVFVTRPADGVDARLTLTLHTNDSAPGRSVVSYELVATAVQPSLSLSPSVLDFDHVPEGESRSLDLTVTNDGTAELVLDGFALSGAPGFALLDGPGRWETSSATASGLEFANPIRLGPGESHVLEVEFAPQGPEPAEGLLRLLSNDPETGESGASVALRGNVGGACLAVTPTFIDFGEQGLGQVATRAVTIRSCGDSPLEIRGLRLLPQSEVPDHPVSPDFQLDLTGLDPALPPGAAEIASGDGPAVLPTGDDGVRTFRVNYLPDGENPAGPDGLPVPDLGVIEILSNSFASPTLVDVRGWGMESPCPTAIIKVQEGDEVIPQTKLHLIGSQSQAFSGSVKKYKWTVEQPTGSQSVFMPSAMAPNPTFEVNAAGVYTFHLDVWDEADKKSCVPAEYEVFVIPDEAIHVELLWNTPADPDQTDETYLGGPDVGSDVDLHFIHPYAFDVGGAAAFDAQFDCFWFNPNPDWGSHDPMVDDDPGLDRDDTDGAGPENVNLNLPQSGMKYRVSIHYWDDHGFGSSLAMVRVYIHGDLAFEVDDIPIQNHDWCDVAQIAWPSEIVTPFSLLETGYVCHQDVTWE